jgi:hypothetical protein
MDFAQEAGITFVNMANQLDEMPEFTCTVPFALGARHVLNWFHANPDQQIVDERLNTVFDQLITTPRPQ